MAGTDFTPGTVLAGRFVLDDLLDENDGASFWRATDRTLVRSVAVHLLADSDERAQPLLTAARTSALVTDAHLLRVLDAAAGDGMVYVVNEWGSGVSLDRLLADGPLSARRAAWVVREVAEAISSAHRHGVSHGRLLPQNVMISEAGSVKLVGFVVDAVLHRGSGRARTRLPRTSRVATSATSARCCTPRSSAGGRARAARRSTRRRPSTAGRCDRDRSAPAYPAHSTRSASGCSTRRHTPT